MPTRQALDSAYLRGLDLVEVSPEIKEDRSGQRVVRPAVCKIMDYGKFLYEQNKKERESKKNQKIVAVKAVRLSVNIGENDFLIKVDQACRFLSDGNRVKVFMRFRGRENNNCAQGERTMVRFAQLCSSFGDAEGSPKKPQDSKIMVMFLSPKRSVATGQGQSTASLGKLLEEKSAASADA